MSNWVKNKVCAVNKDDMQKLIDMLVHCNSNGELITNFNGIIPMPDDLMNTVAGYGYPEWEKKQAENEKKYGYRSWYDFAINKWGTKWDNCGVSVSGGVIEFETAWCIPEGIYLKISQTIPILVAYADEDIGSNCGVLEFRDGSSEEVPIIGTPEQIANAVWGYSYDGDGLGDKSPYNKSTEKALAKILYVEEKKGK